MCDERERLIGFVYEECDDSERQLVETHLDSCSTCRAEISALRDVRQDLLAWRVPLHEAVWRPLPVAAAPAPWWRQVPAWVLAAAASVMFLSGLAGGALASAWLPRAGADAGRPSAVTAQAVTAADLTETEQRILQLMRRELSGIDQKVSMAATPPAARVVNATFPTALAGEVRELQTVSEERDRKLLEVITQTNTDLSRMRARLRDEVLAELRASGSSGGGPLNK
jgi:Putative zinc-finger